MPLVHIGKVTVWGIDGTMTYTGVGLASMDAGDNILEGVTYEDTTEEHERADKKGEVVGLILFKSRENLTLVFYPSADAGSGAIAAAKGNVELPAKGSKVVTALMAGDEINSDKWLYVGGGQIEQGNEQEVKMTLPLRKYATDIAAQVNS